jgi:hypothetical protein
MSRVFIRKQPMLSWKEKDQRFKRTMMYFFNDAILRMLRTWRGPVELRVAIRRCHVKLLPRCWGYSQCPFVFARLAFNVP